MPSLSSQAHGCSLNKQSHPTLTQLCRQELEGGLTRPGRIVNLGLVPEETYLPIHQRYYRVLRTLLVTYSLFRYRIFVYMTISGALPTITEERKKDERVAWKMGRKEYVST